MILKKIDLKLFFISLFIIISILTCVLLVIKPKIHKQFQFGIVEYLIKINSDGSASTTTTTKTTVLRDK